MADLHETITFISWMKQTTTMKSSRRTGLRHDHHHLLGIIIICIACNLMTLVQSFSLVPTTSRTRRGGRITTTTTRPGGPAVAVGGTMTTTVGRLQAQQQQPYEYALLFDCDGVILETEELHRLAYNEAFRKFDLRVDGRPVVWSVRVV
jgi:hypothetical protein